MAGSDERFSSRPPSRNGELPELTLNYVSETSNTTLVDHGQCTNNGINDEKLPDRPGHVQGAKRTAHTGGNSSIQDKRFRGANWEDDDKATLLVGKLSFLVLCMLQCLGLSTFECGKYSSWSHYVAEQLGRAAKSCQGQWDSLLKSRNAICDHEAKIKSGTSSHVSFWQMNEQQKHIANEERRSAKLEPLPRIFQRAWYELMEMISQIDAVRKNPGFRKVAVTNRPSSSTAQFASTITEPGKLSPLGPSNPIESHRPASPFYDWDSMNPSSRQPLVNTQLCQHAEDDGLAMSYNDNLISSIQNVSQKILDDLKTQVVPLLRGQEGNALQKHHREELLALEKEKLAVLRDTLAVKRDKLAVLRDTLAVKREKMQLQLISREASAVANSPHRPEAPEAAFNFKTSLMALGQQPNYIQITPK